MVLTFFGWYDNVPSLHTKERSFDMPMPFKTLPITKEDRKILLDWLITARVNNRMDNGNYYGMNRRESVKMERILDTMVNFCYKD